MITKRQLKQMLQSLTERVERLEAKAELFDKGLEVCVDAHKESLRQIGELKGYPKADKPASQTALKKEAQEWAGSDAVEAYKAGSEWGRKKEDESLRDNFNDGGQWLPLEEAKRKMGIRGNSAIDAFCKRYGLLRRVAAKSKGTIRKRWEVYLTPKKIEELSKRKVYRHPLDLYMRSAQVWAKFYGVSMRDFTPAMKRAGYMPGKDGKWRSKFLTPIQAKEIYEDIKSNATH